MPNLEAFNVGRAYLRENRKVPGKVQFRLRI